MFGKTALRNAQTTNCEEALTVEQGLYQMHYARAPKPIHWQSLRAVKAKMSLPPFQVSFFFCVHLSHCQVSFVFCVHLSHCQVSFFFCVQLSHCQVSFFFFYVYLSHIQALSAWFPRCWFRVRSAALGGHDGHGFLEDSVSSFTLPIKMFILLLTCVGSHDWGKLDPSMTACFNSVSSKVDVPISKVDKLIEFLTASARHCFNP